eukprot:scaffold4428_cov228-Amphora_coffeaeformis.AAC.7
MELPEVQEHRDSCDPRVDAQGNLRRTWDEYELLFNAAEEHIEANMQLVEYKEGWYDARTTGIVFLDEDREMMDYLLCLLSNMLYHLFPNRLRQFLSKIESLNPFFAWVSKDKIKQCLNKATQHYYGVVHYPFRMHFKSWFPAANVPRCTIIQLYYGMSSGYTSSGYPMHLEKQVGEVYEDHIRKVGAPVGILSDRARSEVHGKAKDVMRMYKIDDGQSEPGGDDEEFVSPTETSGERNAPSQGPITNVQDLYDVPIKLPCGIRGTSSWMSIDVKCSDDEAAERFVLQTTTTDHRKAKVKFDTPTPKHVDKYKNNFSRARTKLCDVCESSDILPLSAHRKGRRESGAK